MTSKVTIVTNPNCAACYASLRLYGDALVPEDVSRVLGVEPSDASAKGQITLLPKGRSRTASTGRWILRTETEVSSDNLEEHIGWLLDRLEAAGTRPLDIPGMEDADVFCYWLSATGHGGPEFSPQILARLARLGLKLGLDIYFLPD